ncbi:ABC transporter permease [Agrobacterium sp. SHOUNA12C]|uniref:Ribose ABC transporter n=2 Tax=Rhizobium rhizogenes TaxID=359 RepID=B9JGP3_RHIR8|nr:MULTISPECIES: ABC transporter permease [Rhizobium]ACM24889.1 ribose ABC transporter [Rhizobium rhizogenes K84]KAA6475489.1 ABC transporter permease [Agrobacterium sp. ICMP 7243]MCJ9723257.1 ABC transporter permease [Agrobacterium sp. BETTINA12B]MCJ9758584.1 ABC transporter permease [Agrobacterium sp. SHOUNA12C]OCJ03412.1 ribose ABC transporter [Agrobacterium sp. 13-626]OCJ23375.1 ribose ABC transporter [Agrobacterium sp. B131/95]
MALSAAKPLIRRHSELGIFLIGLVLVVIFSATSDGNWANLYNIGTILQVTATLGLMSLGVALVIGTGEIDISVGSTFGMGALAYLWLAARVDPSVAVMAAILVGSAIGLINGLLVTRTGTPSLIITLGTLMIFRGIAIALTEGFSFSIPYAARKGWTYVVLGGGDFLNFNTAFYWLIVVLVVLWVMLKAMPFGNRLLAVGGSAESAHSRGVRVDRIKLSAFVLCGMLAAFGGALEAGKLGFADGSMGRLMELQAIASCVLGGCLLAGGRISLIGALMGAFVLSSIQSYLVVMGVQPQWFILILGMIVVLAAYGDRSLRQWALKK